MIGIICPTKLYSKIRELQYFSCVFLFGLIILSSVDAFADVTIKKETYTCPPGYTLMPSYANVSSGTCIKNQSLNNCNSAYATDLAMNSNCLINSVMSGDGVAAEFSRSCEGHNCDPTLMDDLEMLDTMYGNEPVSNEPSKGNPKNGSAGSGNSGASGNCASGKDYSPTLGCVNSDTMVEQCLEHAHSAGGGSASVQAYKRCMGEDSGSGATASGGCDAAYQELVMACSQKVNTAVNRCDENADTGMAKWSKNIESTMAVAQGASSQMGINSACSQVNTALMGAKAAVASFNTICEFNISSCHSACNKALSDARAKGCEDTGAVQDGIQSCTKLKSKAQNIAASIQSMTQNAAMAKTCSNLTLGTMEVANTTDCNLAANANNMVCKCQKNPYDPACTTASNSATSGETLTQASQIDRKSPRNLDMGGLPLDEPSVAGNLRPPSALDTSGTGRQGGGANLNIGGGSGGGGNAGPDGAAPGAGQSANILSGFRGGSISGSGRGSGNSYGGGGRMGYAAGGLPQTKNGKVDLRQFLPGGSMYKRRGISGSYAGPDGITGPHGSIWLKVNTRYRSLQKSLLP